MVSFFNPQNETDIKRKRMMADQLKALSKPQETQMVSGIAIPNSPLSGLAQALAQVGATSQEMDAENLQTKDALDRQKFMAELIKNSGSDPQALAQGLLSNPSTMDSGLSLYSKNLEAQAENAKWEKDAALKRELANMRRGGGEPYVDPETGEIVHPERKLSSTEQKELFDTMDTQASGEGALTAMHKAKQILLNSPKGAEPYSGFGAETRAELARLPIVGDLVADKNRGATTTEYRTLITEQALGSLKSIFGGMPTEGERKILLEMQSLPNQTPQEQERIINNAMAAAQVRLNSNKAKIQGIQTGSYKSPATTQPAQGGWSIEELP